MNFSNRKILFVLLALCMSSTQMAQAGFKGHKLPEAPDSFKDSASHKVAVIVMHGKDSTPTKWLGNVNNTLRKSGFWVIAPEMPWGHRRDFDVGYEDAMLEIKDMVTELRKSGATHVYVGGHSMGATAAVGYAARDHGIDGVFMLAPGHTPESSGFQEKLGSSPVKAYRMIQQGKGDKKSSFNDINNGKSRSIRTTANIYSSYFKLTGPANVGENMRAIGEKTAIFWANGESDTLYLSFHQRAENYLGFAPANPDHELHVVEGGHLSSPYAAREKLIAWLNKVSR